MTGDLGVDMPLFAFPVRLSRWLRSLQVEGLESFGVGSWFSMTETIHLGEEMNRAHLDASE